MGLHLVVKCPQCDMDKTFVHMLWCSFNGGAKRCSTFTCSLQKTMLAYTTHDNIIQCIVACLDQWFEDGEVIPFCHPVTFCEAIWMQNRIGWDCFFMGKLAQEWLEVFKELKPFVHKGTRKVEGYV